MKIHKNKLNTIWKFFKSPAHEYVNQSEDTSQQYIFSQIGHNCLYWFACTVCSLAARVNFFPQLKVTHQISQMSGQIYLNNNKNN